MAAAGTVGAGQPGAATTRRSRPAWAWSSSPIRWPSRPGSPTRCQRCRSALRSAYRVVLLDEYQDTSAAQAIMLRGLFGGFTPSEGMGHPVTAVGDPFQAIYGWRGAASSNILLFAQDFPPRRGDRQRATPSPSIGGAAARSSTWPTGSVRRCGAGPGLGWKPTRKDWVCWRRRRHPCGTVRAATFATWPEEVGWIADQVVAARDRGAADRWADIAVLTRRNADIAPLYGELTSRDVPVEIVGLGGLLQLPEVMDVTATLRRARRRHRQPRPPPTADRSPVADRAARPGPAGTPGARTVHVRTVHIAT